MRSVSWKLAAATVSLAIFVAARAQSTAAQDAGHPHRPPPEALQACASLAEGAACTFSLGDQSVSGTCRTGPHGEAAACMPAQPPHHGPPPEAFEACNGLSEGQTCTVSFQGGSMSGACRSGPDGGALACAPNGPPPAR